MWSATIEATNNSALINRLAIKHNISFFGYPLNTKVNKDFLEVTFYGWTNNSISSTKSFYDDLVSDSQILNAEFQEQSIIICIKQPLEVVSMYSSDVIYLKPILVKPTGVQEYVVGSWDRSVLEKVLRIKVPKIKLTLKNISQKTIENISLFAPVKLTKKQNDAFHLAQESGYYSFPKRNIHLKELAKESNVSLATYQAHLRKAEKKILNAYSSLT